MSAEALFDEYLACAPPEKTVLSLFAAYGEPLKRMRLLGALRELGVRDGKGKAFASPSLTDLLAALRKRKLIEEQEGLGFCCTPELQIPILRSLAHNSELDRLCQALSPAREVQKSYDGSLYVRTYQEGMAQLRMALLRGQPPEQVFPWLEACLAFGKFNRQHPLVEICGNSFEPALFSCLHPLMQEQAMAILLARAPYMPETASALIAWSEQAVAPGQPAGDRLTIGLVELLLACGRLADAAALLDKFDGALPQALRAGLRLLQGALDEAADGFEAALKRARKETGKRNTVFGGVISHLFLLALIRSANPGHHKLADTCFDLMLRAGYAIPPVNRQLYLLRQVQAGTMPAETVLEFEAVAQQDMLSQLFQALLYHWLALPRLAQLELRLIELVARAEKTGFPFIAAQAAELLHRGCGRPEYAKKAAALRQQFRLDDLCDWFRQQESWERQLAALINMQPAAVPRAASQAQTRLIWLVDYLDEYRTVHVEPREQKRDARSNWSRGRTPALKRLREGAGKLDFLTAQDIRVTSAIRVHSNYYDGVSYSIDGKQALAELIGHPLVFRRDAPEARVEILAGRPELLIREKRGHVTLSLQPAIDADADDVLVVKETPTRLRVFSIGDQHRRIAAVLGAGLSVPPHAREQVLKAVESISSLVTVQSDIGGGGAGIEQVQADPRLHVHLLPYDAGLKVQLLVRPLVGGGPYYAPGQGTANVIAELDGKRVQAQRDLAAERACAKKLVGACDSLKNAEEAHGERLLTEPQDCLELLTQLQEHAADAVIAWPEGEKFRIQARAGAAAMRMTVKSERDWFAAGGELRVDENTVLDLRRLLELVQQSTGRFIPLGGNRFLALTQEFHRRLSELSAFGDPHGKGIRVHPLAAFALEDLAGEAPEFKADARWKAHIQRLRELDSFEPRLPSTLQAELRDYQAAGYNWLARLAHWGVGACLADDMGLGKTVQALALLLARAPQGPALVVAPTSVSINWMSETARFAPTLRPLLFGRPGSGDRGSVLSALQPFDVIVVSYGLLQQESELFAGVDWHTIVLDEAQAIKNTAAKRSQAVMALKGGFRMAVTGTPLENHLGELWNLFRFINPGLLGSLEQFNQRFAQPIERQQDATARARLRRLIQPFILRRTKTQVLSELPSRTEIMLPVDLSQEETAFYEALRRNALDKLEQDDAPAGQKSLRILAEIMRLRRACCHPQLVAPELGLPSSKLAAFTTLLEELLENRHKALVFSQFVDHLTLIRAALDRRGIRYQYLDGATALQERKKRVDAFQAGEGDVFLISLKAGGTGLNLTAADYVIHMDPWWNPAVEDQASDRAHRMGQQRPVTIYRLVARHTIEESIVDLHKHKRDLADSLLEGSDSASRLSTQEMLKLLMGDARPAGTPAAVAAAGRRRAR